MCCVDGAAEQFWTVEYFEDLTVGYQEQPTDQDLNDLFEDFLESGERLDDYLRQGQQESNGSV